MCNKTLDKIALAQTTKIFVCNIFYIILWAARFIEHNIILTSFCKCKMQ
jgi:hypothetical protein